MGKGTEYFKFMSPPVKSTRDTHNWVDGKAECVTSFETSFFGYSGGK